MTIALDRSKPYLRPSQLEELVLAVVKAEAQDEDDAIEWKSTLDLQQPKAIGHHLARQIIGFANRMPGDAAKRYGGHGYLVVGASPGETKGIPAIDPAHLVQKLRPYLGGQLSWAPEFVTVGDARIMVIIIDPPDFGDPIHALHKRLDNWHLGAVFVRRHGNTELADPVDLNRLAARSHPGPATSEISVEASGPVEAWPDPRFIDACQEELQWSLRGPSKDLLEKEHQARFYRDTEDAGLARIFWALSRTAPTSLQLTVTNRTDKPAKDVRVRIASESAFQLSQQWRRFTRVRGPWELPEIRRYDSRNRTQFREKGLVPFPSAREWNDGTWQTPLGHAFEVVDLHPRSEHFLSPLPLITSGDVTPIMVNWEAASMNHNGVSSGVIEVEIVRFERWQFDTNEMLLKRR